MAGDAKPASDLRRPRIEIEEGVETANYEGVEYEDFWTGIDKEKLDALERAIVGELLPPRGRRILEVGCGYGRLADTYLDRFDEVVLTDPSLSLLGHARERYGDRATYVAADVHHLPFRDDAFDAILMVRVFHHLPDSRAALAELGRVTRGRGRLVFNYSNKRNLLRAVKFAARRGDSPFGLEPVRLKPALYGHHPAFVGRLLRELHFDDIRYRGAGIVDKLAPGLGSLGVKLPPGEALAGPLGIVKLGPIVFVSAEAPGGPLARGDAIADLFACPACGGALAEETGAYRCAGCGRSYPVADGIVDLRPA